MVHLCPQCGFCGKDNYHLKRHRMIHTGEKPFKCTDCDYATNNSYHLSRHRSVHDPAKPIVCDDDACNYRFATVAALERHRIAHRQRTKGPKKKTRGSRKGPGRYTCDHCDFRATRKAALTQHIKDAHGAAGAKTPEPMPAGQELAGECVVCQEEEATFMCVPCAHQCVCGLPECTGGIMRSRKCPMCQNSITELRQAVK
eukprot:m.216247 g.216247  ORF g.216247 m.216247 type:complete len:200 (-) comp28235_c0_seq1:148-747(-)